MELLDPRQHRQGRLRGLGRPLPDPQRLARLARLEMRLAQEQGGGDEVGLGAQGILQMRNRAGPIPLFEPLPAIS